MSELLEVERKMGESRAMQKWKYHDYDGMRRKREWSETVREAENALEAQSEDAGCG